MKGADGVEKTVWDRLFVALVTAIYIFLMFPIVLVVLLSFNSGEFLAFPLEGFSLRWFESLFSNSRFLDATLYSCASPPSQRWSTASSARSRPSTSPAKIGRARV